MELFPATITSGQLSEEPAEASNHDVKAFQVDHSRQCSVVMRNEDTFNRMMDRSDPKVASHLVDKKLRKRSKDAFPKEVLDLCVDSDALLNSLMETE